jgi:hypothetical protein
MNPNGARFRVLLDLDRGGDVGRTHRVTRDYSICQARLIEVLAVINAWNTP